MDKSVRIEGRKTAIGVRRGLFLKSGGKKNISERNYSHYKRGAMSM